MRSKVNTRNAVRALMILVAGWVLAGCGGGGDPDLDLGPDFSSSPLQWKSVFDQDNPQLFGQIAFVWDEIDGATHYRFFADVDGATGGEFDFIQIGADIPAGTDPLEAVFDGIPGKPFSAHTFDWQRARFMLQSCDAGGCTEVGQQDVRNVSSAFILPILGAGSSVAYAESDDTVVVGSVTTSSIPCETLTAVTVEELEEGETLGFCEYDDTLTQEEIDALQLRQTTLPCDTIIPVETPANECEYDETLTQTEIDELDLRRGIVFAGSANIYVLNDGLWELQQELFASNMEQGDSFGTSVAISNDGNTVVVSALNEDSNATGVDGDGSNNDEADSGAAYVFKRDGMGVWTEAAYIKPSTVQGGDVDEADLFGSFLALSADGTVLAVSAWFEDSNSMLVDGDESDNSAKDAGAVFVFRDTASVWAQDAYLKPINTSAGDLFGSSLAISAAGDRLAIGALNESSNASGIDGDAFNNNSSESGAVYIFDYSGSWMHSAYIKAATPDSRDAFGAAVSLNAAGDILAVSAPKEDSGSSGVSGDPSNNDIPSTGAVYVFNESGMGWSQTAYLKASNADPVDEFGHAVRLNATGDKLVATSIREGGRSSGINGGQELDDFVAAGAGYFFINEGGWQQEAYIKAPNNSFNALFGWQVDFSADGVRMVISAFNTASVYIF